MRGKCCVPRDGKIERSNEFRCRNIRRRWKMQLVANKLHYEALEVLRLDMA